MNQQSLEKIKTYWFEEAGRNIEDMNFFFVSGRFTWTLFVGHLALEKVLKGIVVDKTGKHAPHTHNLRRLAEIAELNLDEESISFLEEVTDFNLSARYPEMKKSFYELCTEEFTKPRKDKILELYESLCNQIKK